MDQIPGSGQPPRLARAFFHPASARHATTHESSVPGQAEVQRGGTHPDLCFVQVHGNKSSRLSFTLRFPLRTVSIAGRLLFYWSNVLYCGARVAIHSCSRARAMNPVEGGARHSQPECESGMSDVGVCDNQRDSEELTRYLLPRSSKDTIRRMVTA